MSEQLKNVLEFGSELIEILSTENELSKEEIEAIAKFATELDDFGATFQVLDELLMTKLKPHLEKFAEFNAVIENDAIGAEVEIDSTSSGEIKFEDGLPEDYEIEEA